MEKEKVKLRKGLVITFVVALICTIPVGIGTLRMGWAIHRVCGFDISIPLVILSVFSILFIAFSMMKQYPNFLFRLLTWITGLHACVLAYFIPSMTSASIVLAICGQSWKGVAKPVVIFIITVGSVITVIYGLIHARRLFVKYYKVKAGAYKEKTGRIPEEVYRIVQLSDLHIGSVIGPSYIRRVVKKVNSLKPDMVVVTGDIFNHGGVDECRDIKKVIKAFQDMRSTDGIYAVLGNHDPDLTDPGMEEFVRDTKMNFIDNSVCDTRKLLLVGRTGLLTDRTLRLPINEVMEGVDTEKPLVVLDHDPRGADDARDIGADLILSGHTHRGQFFPVILMSKDANGKNYFYGRIEFGKTTSIISSGTGSFQLPIRVGTNSEIVCVDLEI